MYNENKVLVKLYIPKIEVDYEVFLPVNKQIKEIVVLLGKAIHELTNGVYIVTNTEHLYNRDTGKEYSFESLLKDTNIRNGSELIYL